MKAIPLDLVWKEYHLSIRRFLHSKISNSEDVDDLLQEIMIKTQKGIESLHSTNKLKPWLFQLAKNSIIDFYRKKSRTPQVEFLDFLTEDKNDHNEVEQDLSQCVLPFIELLDQEDRDLLLAIDINGLSQKDYALQHEIAYSTLKSRLKKARLKLRTSFEDCCEFSFNPQGKIIDYTQK